MAITSSLIVICNASASPDLARSWGELASELATELDQLSHDTGLGTKLPSTAMLKLQQFGLVASQLSRANKQGGGPDDLTCIFNGMADETGTQLSAIKSGADQIAMDRLIMMLEDAVIISQSAEIAFGRGEAGDDGANQSTCPASLN